MTNSPDLQAGITRDIYGMPAFISLQVVDVRETAAWWMNALGFIELFAMPPGDDPSLIHLRRWRYQDVLVRRGPAAQVGDGVQVTFAADHDALDALAARARGTGAPTVGPAATAWNTTDVTVITPEGLTVVFTARRPEQSRDADFTAAMERWTDQKG